MASQYELKEKLSEGPGGSVWRYRDTHTGHPVAIKRVDPGTSMDVDTVMNMLQAVKDNRHKNIAKLIRSFTDNVEGVQYNFIVYQYYSYGTLVDLLKKKGPLPIEYVRSIIRQVVAGVNHWHLKVGKRHGDIKLQNILFQNQEWTEIVIGDIGLALPEGINSSVKKSILVGGTTEYLSYELLKEQKMGKPVDVWAIGVITFVLLCNSFPFHFFTGKEMKEGVPKEIKTVDDFSKETVNPIVKAADRFIQDAVVKIEIGIDWSPFRTDLEYDLARDFILHLLDTNYDTRLTIEEAVGHQFLNVSKLVKPAPPPASTVSGSKSKRHFDAITVSSKDKLLRSEYGSSQCHRVGMRGGGSQIFLEDLSFWKQKAVMIQRADIKTQLLLLLSVRAGYKWENGKFKFIPNPRMWAESGLLSAPPASASNTNTDASNSSSAPSEVTSASRPVSTSTTSHVSRRSRHSKASSKHGERNERRRFSGAESKQSGVSTRKTQSNHDAEQGHTGHGKRREKHHETKNERPTSTRGEQKKREKKRGSRDSLIRTDSRAHRRKERASDLPVIPSLPSSGFSEGSRLVIDASPGSSTETGSMTSTYEAGPATSFTGANDESYFSDAPSEAPQGNMHLIGDEKARRKEERRREQLKRHVEKAMSRRTIDERIEVSTMASGSTRSSSRSENKGKK